MALKIDRDASMGDINVWRGEFEPARNAANAVFLFHPLSILDAKFAFSDQRSKNSLNVSIKPTCKKELFPTSSGHHWKSSTLRFLVVTN